MEISQPIDVTDSHPEREPHDPNSRSIFKCACPIIRSIAVSGQWRKVGMFGSFALAAQTK